MRRLLLLILLVPLPALTGERSGIVTSVHDGDTFRITLSDIRVAVRLSGVDCPELSQTWGGEARAVTEMLAHNKEATLVWTGKIIPQDRYGRYLGDLRLEDTRMLSHVLVMSGSCWWAEEHDPKNDTLKALQEKARLAKAGLWAFPSPVPPWEFRKARK